MIINNMDKKERGFSLGIYSCSICVSCLIINFIKSKSLKARRLMSFYN